MKLLTLILCVLCVSARDIRSQSAARSTLTRTSDGCVGLWRLGGEIGVDLSSRANNGSFSNAPAYAVGMVGAARSFTAASSQFVHANYSASLDNRSRQTFTAWIKPGDLHNYGTIGGRWHDGGNNNNVWFVALFADGKIYAYHSTNGADFPSVASVSTVATGVWTHVAVTWDDSDASAGKKIYLNGTLNASGAMATMSAETTPMRIANAILFAGGNHYFTGTIDEIHLFSRVLSATEIRQLYANTKLR